MSFGDFHETFTVTQYPSGESHVQLGFNPTPWPHVMVYPNARTFQDLGNVVIADRLIRRNRCEPRVWFVPFFPFARDDRRASHYDAFELELALELVKGIDITILDPHSDVAGQLPHIPQSEVVNLWRPLIEKACAREIVWVIPDAGAAKKAHTWIRPGERYVQGTKHRDTATGKLSAQAVDYTDCGAIEGKDCVIVDDICDAGGTFLGLAQLLRDERPRSLNLAVTHGLFTKGTDRLFAAFNHIFTTGPQDDPRVVSVPYADVWQAGLPL